MTTTFETGATTHQANDLIRTTMNDGALYDDRKHAGFALLQGASHRVSFRDIVASTADTLRKTGGRFSAAHIKEAATIVREQTVRHCLELMRDEWDRARPITCIGRTWWDRVNGNTYFSARILVPTIDGSRWFSVPFQYGYGGQWMAECAAVLKRAGFTDLKQSDVLYSFDGAHLRRNMYRGIFV